MGVDAERFWERQFRFQKLVAKRRLPELSKFVEEIFPDVEMIYINHKTDELNVSYSVGKNTRNLKYSRILFRENDSIKKEMMEDYENESEWERKQSLKKRKSGSDSSPGTCLRCGYRTSSSYSVRSYNGRKVCSTCNDSMSDW